MASALTWFIRLVHQQKNPLMPCHSPNPPSSWGVLPAFEVPWSAHREALVQRRHMDSALTGMPIARWGARHNKHGVAGNEVCGTAEDIVLPPRLAGYQRSIEAQHPL